MSEIIAQYYNLPIYITKYTFKERVFKLNDIRGSLIDEIRKIGNFDRIFLNPNPCNFKLIKNSEKETDYPLMDFENNKATKILEVEDSYIRFHSAIGDNYHHIACNYINEIFKKLEFTPDCGSFGTAVSYFYNLEQENFTSLWDKFNCYKELNFTNEAIKQDNLDEFTYQNVYRKNEEEYIIKIILNKAHVERTKPNCQIYIDNKIKNKNIEHMDKKIKESLKFAINVVNEIGLKVK